MTTTGAPQNADIIVKNGVIVTVDTNRRIVMNGAVAISGSRIAAVGKTAEIEASFRAKQVIDAHGSVVQPGFVDCHVHLSQQL